MKHMIGELSTSAMGWVFGLIAAVISGRTVLAMRADAERKNSDAESIRKRLKCLESTILDEKEVDARVLLQVQPLLIHHEHTGPLLEEMIKAHRELDKSLALLEQKLNTQ